MLNVRDECIYLFTFQTKAAFSNVNKQLRLIKGVEFSMANRIYVAQDAQLNKQFADLSKDVFNSDVKNVDFSKSKETSNEINTWVTHNPFTS